MHGRVTALTHPTMETLASAQFLRRWSTADPYPYFVASRHSIEEVHAWVAEAPATVHARILTPGSTIEAAMHQLKEEGIDRLLVEGGPTLLTQFFEEDLIDELFLTIAPTVIGHDAATLTLTTGHRFPANSLLRFRLISHVAAGDELYLHYRRRMEQS